MSMFRKWVIGSIMLHLGLISGSGFWFSPQLAAPPEEVYLEIFTDSSWEAKGDPLTAVVSKIPIRQEFGTVRVGLERSTLRDREEIANQIIAPVQTEKTTANPKVNDQAQSKHELKEESTASTDLPTIVQPNSSKVGTEGSLKITHNFENIDTEQATNQAGNDSKDLSRHIGPVTGNGYGKPESVVADLPAIDTPAVILKDVKPVYPALAKRNNWSGTVVLLVEVKTDGKIGEVVIIQSSGYKILDQEVVRAVKKRQYQPDLKNGRPVVVFRRVPYTFKLEG